MPRKKTKLTEHGLLTYDTIREIEQGLKKLEANPKQSRGVLALCQKMRQQLEAYQRRKAPEIAGERA